jgi:hypothetical protein
MRIVGNRRIKKYRYGPTPLEICPGRETWEKFRNSEYLVFVDESFYKFFGFADVDGNFCHAALGVPESRYANLQTSMNPLVETCKDEISQREGQRPQELKSTSFSRSPLEFRSNFTKEFVRILGAHGGFVAAFYSSTRGIVMERVRTNIMDEAEAVPQDHVDLYAQARMELLDEFRGVGQSELVKKLLLLPFSGLWNFLGSFNCSFRVRYDPRESSEDQTVRDAIVQYMQTLINVPELYGSTNPLLGMEIDIPSHNDLGLQLVDLVAGEVRSFFRRNPEALTENSSLQLITNDSDDPVEHFLEFGNALHKIGALSSMSTSLRDKLGVANSDNLISYYYPVLAAGIWACVSETGQPRLLEVPTELILDQAE